MKHFRTIYAAKKGDSSISYADNLFLIGSCFSENMASYLTYRKFKTLSNPYGILFNPVSIFCSLQEIIQLKQYVEEDLIPQNDLWQSLSHHSCFSHPDKQLILAQINQQIDDAHHFLKQSKFLFITLGSSWVYEYEDKIVANCHKIPNAQFAKRLLRTDEIVEQAKETVNQVLAFNPNLQIVFTISPVRHLKDGMMENNLSKSILRTAIHEIEQSLEAVSYFPSYEILLDDLRDYRFYGKDLLHPNEIAIEYIWEKFSETYFNSETTKKMERVEKLQAAIDHKPRFENSVAHQKHLAYIQREKESLKDLYLMNE